MKEELSREGEMDKKSLILIALFFFLVFLSVGASYYRFFVVRDYTVHVQAPCDPAAEKCFVYECDDSIGECTGDPASDTTYYKLVDRSAHSMPMCNPADSACGAYVCPESEVGCTVSVCDDVLAESEGVYCSDPETYAIKISGEETLLESAPSDQSG
ncbi:MAG: hypothetical protein ACEQSB_06070, partial [Undibacterium sp.]